MGVLFGGKKYILNDHNVKVYGVVRKKHDEQTPKNSKLTGYKIMHLGLDFDGTIADVAWLKQRYILDQWNIHVDIADTGRRVALPMLGDKHYEEMLFAVHQTELVLEIPPKRWFQFYLIVPITMVLSCRHLFEMLIIGLHLKK